MDRQLIGRLAIAGIAVAAVAATVVILGTGDDPAPAPVAVSAPTTGVPQRAPDRTVTRTLAPTTSTAPVAPAPSTWQITYELAGSGTATVVYDDNGLGLVQQELSVSLPWRKTLTWPKTDVAPTVQLMGQSSGPVECRVSVNGVLARSSKAADGEVASCAGRLS